MSKILEIVYEKLDPNFYFAEKHENYNFFTTLENSTLPPFAIHIILIAFLIHQNIQYQITGR